MAKIVYTLIKFCREEQHCRDLQHGSLYLNKIKTFRSYPDNDGTLRGDPFEGVVGILQPNRVNVEYNGIRIDPRSISGPILVHDSQLLEKHAFCLYAVNSGEWSQIREDQVEAFRREMAIHQHAYGLGPLAVVFTNADEFKNRIIAALERAGCNYRMGLMDYYNSSTAMGMFDQTRWGFQKRDEYRGLNEYRLLIDRPILSSDHPHRFEIGTLADISVVVPSEDLREALTIQVAQDPGAGSSL